MVMEKTPDTHGVLVAVHVTEYIHPYTLSIAE